MLLSTPAPVVEPFSPAQLGCSSQTWQTMLRDGDLVEVRPGHAVLPGTVVTAAVRARSLSDHLPRHVVVGRATAAWVHTGVPLLDQRIRVLYSPGGYRPRENATVLVSQSSVRGWEVELVGDVPVTSVVRTAMDVATWCPRAFAERALSALLRVGLDVEDALARLDRVASWRGADRARSLLRAARASGRPSPLPEAQTAVTGSEAFEPVMR